MLDYKQNTLDYGQLLNPPTGYRLERAVCTTYSLDLLALLAIPVALFYQRNLDGDVTGDRMDILDAIQRSADKLVVYCQKGRIAVPQRSAKALCFIEDCVREVFPADARTSFHPKVWVMKYTSDQGPPLFRVLIGSRNLTLDRSWDVAYFLEGFVQEEERTANAPLADLLEWLIAKGDFPGSAAFVNDLRRVAFVVEEPFTDHAFHPMGIPAHTNPMLSARFTDLLVVSPFVDVRALDVLKSNSTGQRWLFCRREELDKLPIEVFEGWETYMFSQRVEEGEADEGIRESGKDAPMPQQLHAKLFVGTTTRGRSNWYLGSANCSAAALDRNQEVLLRLHGTDTRLSPQALATSLTGVASGLAVFERYVRTSTEPTEEAEYDYRVAMHALLLALESETVEATCQERTDGSGQYDVRLSCAQPFLAADGVTITCAPLGWPGEEQKAEGRFQLLFSGMGLYQLSPFISWTMTKEDHKAVRFLTRMKLALPANRQDAIFRSLVDTRDKFFQFIRFLLGEGESDIFFHEHRLGERRWGAGAGGTTTYPLLEELLVAASRHPERLRAIDKVVERMLRSGAEDLVPPEFLLIWKEFKPFAHE